MFSPHVTVACIIKYKQKYLMVEEQDNGRIVLNQPAGHLESDESLIDAAAREVWEETEALVNIKGVVSLYSIPHINQVYIHFWGEMLTADFNCGIESSEVQLFTEEEIPWDKIAFTSSTFTLKNFFDDRRKGQHVIHRGYLEL